MTMDVITPRNDDHSAPGHPDGWWRARDGQWYPPERRPNPLLVAPEVTVVRVRTTATRRDLVGLGRRAGIGLAVIVALVGGGSFLRDGGGPVATMSQTLSREPSTTTVPTTTSSVPDTTTTSATPTAPTADAAPPAPPPAPPTTVPAKASKRSRTASAVAPSAPVAAWPAVGDAPSGPVSQPSGPVPVAADGPASTTPPTTTPPTTTPPEPPTTVAPAPAP